MKESLWTRGRHKFKTIINTVCFQTGKSRYLGNVNLVCHFTLKRKWSVYATLWSPLIIT